MLTKSQNCHLEVEDIGDVSLVRFTSKRLLDPTEIQLVGMELFRLVDELGRRHVILDLGNVEYVSSAALGKFITLYKKVKAVGGRLVIRNINAQVRELFQLSDLPWEAADDPEFPPNNNQPPREPPLVADLRP
jgi:anti-sigma B factor antagonist